MILEREDARDVSAAREAPVSKMRAARSR